METVVKFIKEKALTIIMATHFPNHAFYFQNNFIDTSILMMNNRQVAAVGKPDIVLSTENIRKVFKVSAKVLTYFEREENRKSNYIIPLYTLDESENKKECYL